MNAINNSLDKRFCFVWARRTSTAAPKSRYSFSSIPRNRTAMLLYAPRPIIALSFVLGATTTGQALAQDATALFEPIRSVLQHPRCQNCHIPGEAPLQYDSGTPHAQNVQRNADGRGMPAMECAACHTSANSPASYGAHAPPGAPNWHLPPRATKMVFIGLSPRELCMVLKDGSTNGGKSLAQLDTHMSDDKLVGWGWNPGGERTVPPITREQLTTAFRAWVKAGAPCPAQ